MKSFENKIVSETDIAKTPSSVDPDVSEIIEKWYRKLNFPSRFNSEFYTALRTITISAETSVDSYDLDGQDGKKNLLSFLYMCEALEKTYQSREIPEEILLDTLSDLVRWTKTWSELKGELYLGELPWLSYHMRMKLFKIGRLQFAMQDSDWDVPEYALQKGEAIIGIHIPAGGALLPEECTASLKRAKLFFERFFPEYRYRLFTCHSWLLDETLATLLPPDSNILKFQMLFKRVGADPSDAILGYVFRWRANRETALGMHPSSSLAKKVQQHLLDGGTFYEALGIIAPEAYV